jgi:hypothetical protein
MLRSLAFVSALMVGGSAFAIGEACMTNDQCGTLEFCDTEQSVSCNAGGTCASRGGALMCTTIKDPVCGCDGATYDNDCVAHKAGISVAYVGACTTGTSGSGGGCG